MAYLVPIGEVGWSWVEVGFLKLVSRPVLQSIPAIPPAPRAVLSVLLKALLLVRLLKGRLTRGVGGCEHVLWIGSRLGPDHVVAGVVEVGHGCPAQAGRGEDGLVYCIFLQTSSGTPTRHGRRVAVHGRSRQVGVERHLVREV